MAGNKKKSMENAVDSFLEVFLPKGTKNQVMVIPYGSDTDKGILNFTSNASSVANFLDSKYANGGTNIHAALEDAYDYIGEDTTVILMTDGEPTYYRYYYILFGFNYNISTDIYFVFYSYSSFISIVKPLYVNTDINLPKFYILTFVQL